MMNGLYAVSPEEEIRLPCGSIASGGERTAQQAQLPLANTLKQKFLVKEWLQKLGDPSATRFIEAKSQIKSVP